MTCFDDLFAERAAPVLLARFGEWINYLPKSGPPRRIRATVDRGPLLGPTEATELLSPSVTIEVLDDPRQGIASARLDTGGDRVELPLWPGQPKRALPITLRLPQKDQGMILLRCGE